MELSLLISAIALIFSIISFFMASQLTKGQVEMQIREMISTSRYRYSEAACKLSTDSQNKIFQNAVNAALEEVLNSYDEACAKYIDRKVDKNRFRKLYFSEIRNLIEEDITKDKYILPKSKFQATVKVYNEWHNLEK